MTSITVAESPRVLATLRLADDALVLAHRLSEWIGRAPMLEEELALGNLALDLLGQARLLYTHAAALEGQGRGEDDLAYRRDAPAYRNRLMLELPRGDFAFTMLRQFLYAAWAQPFWQAMQSSTDATLAAVAAKAVKEMAYHQRHAATWVVRLGDGTAESHARTAAALEELWPYTGELFDVDATDEVLIAEGVLADPRALRPGWDATVDRVLAEAELARPRDGWMQSGGRRGVHTEHLGHMLAVMQHLQRAYPGAVW